MGYRVDAQKKSVSIIAHGGASGSEPANTLPAFERAIAMGADWIELDLSVSRDGELVVVHGPVIQGHPVDCLTAAELQAIPLPGGNRIPTFTQAVDLIGGRCCLYLDIKSFKVTQALIEAPQELESSVIAASFHIDVLAEIKKHRPRIRTSVLFGSEHVNEVKLAQAVGADFVHPCWERFDRPDQILAPRISRIRDKKLGIVTWHEERLEILEALLGMDVDGICTDCPDVLLKMRHSINRQLVNEDMQ